MAQHLSFRVPWHDNGWNGTVCTNPDENQACLRLKNIAENKDISLELDNSGKYIFDCKAPCVKEGGAFMSEKSFVVESVHPYSKINSYVNHTHLLPTHLTFPPYSYPATPFIWVMKHHNNNFNDDNLAKLSEKFGFEYSSNIEPSFIDEKNKKKKNIWLQNGTNQKRAFNAFFDDVEPNESICVFYSKQIPYTDDPRRVIVGIGHILKVNSPIMYSSSDSKKMPSCLWENIVEHSIRPNMSDGFLLPYTQFVNYAEQHPDFDLSKVFVYADSEYFEEYCYKTEHLSHDAVIDVILQCINTINLAKECKLIGDWDRCLEWLNNELLKTWKDRGAFPGLGSMLISIGISTGILVAKELCEKAKENNLDIWNLLDKAIDNPDSFFRNKQIVKGIYDECRTVWKNALRKDKEKYRFFILLSRIDLTTDQAKFLFTTDFRENQKDILDNPYSLYEFTHELANDKVLTVKKLDRAFFPPEYISKKYPMDSRSRIDSAFDKRRVRALICYALEEAAANGSTLLPQKLLKNYIVDMTLDPKYEITEDILEAHYEFIKKEIIIKNDVNGKKYYKLKRYETIDKLIQRQIDARTKKDSRLVVNVNWINEINNALPEYSPDDIDEHNARLEKAAALKTLAESRFSVLIGGAGTGKTKVLNILCSVPEISSGGILLLAPTGKARIRMQSGERKAFTIAQFLYKNGYYDGETQRYLLKQDVSQWYREKAVPQTVIIDESSMITEDMMGSLLVAISSARRIILVGDNNQLPPIGAGRPFVDIINYLKKKTDISKFPAVGENIAKLTITRRQKTSNEVERSDTRLAKWFISGDNSNDDEIFSQIISKSEIDNVIFKRWKNKEDLYSLLCSTIEEITAIEGKSAEEAFNISFGGFSITNTKLPTEVSKVENWQILSPVRNNEVGVVEINQLLHEKYRGKAVRYFLEQKCRDSKYPQPFGAERLISGDKVINVENQHLKCFPEDGHNYVANGEIGLVTKKLLKDTNNKYHFNIEFSTQENTLYDYLKCQKSETEQSIELAYALTVHKAQGSQFKAVILILTDKCRLMSREMIYTALTRQEDKIFILYDNDLYELSKYSNDRYSEIACRYTDLFFMPNVVLAGNKYFEEGLIHKTISGELVRSKSEVIIYNILESVKEEEGMIDFEYERKITLKDGHTFLPDFYIVNGALDKDYIWEHLGLTTDSKYMERWNKKKEIYRANGYSEEKGNLIVTRDGSDGSIESDAILQIAKML